MSVLRMLRQGVSLRSRNKTMQNAPVAQGQRFEADGLASYPPAVVLVSTPHIEQQHSRAAPGLALGSLEILPQLERADFGRKGDLEGLARG